LISLVVLATVLILVGISVSDDQSLVKNSEGLTGKQISDATKLATNDELFRSSYNSSQDNYWVGNVIPSLFSEYGYVNVSGTFLDVPIQLRESAPMRQDFTYTVDLDTSTVMIQKLVYSEGLMGSSIYAKLPPNSYFYKSYDNTFSYLFYNYPLDNPVVANNAISMDVQPGGKVIPMFLDMNNFEKFRNNTPYDTLRYVSYPNNTTYVPGNDPIQGNWSAYIPAGHNGLYMVFLNDDQQRNATITLNQRPMPFMG
jgi:hypothetical protein